MPLTAVKDHISIRAGGCGDAAGILAIYAPIVSETAISFEDEPPSLEQLEDRIVKSHVWLVAEVRDEIVGYCYATHLHPRSAYRWSAEISVYLGPAARGQGVGTKLLADSLERLRGMGFVNAFAGITLPNEASLRLFESSGFRKIAHWDQVGFKCGAWHDVGWWQLRLQPPAIPPPPLARHL